MKSILFVALMTVSALGVSNLVAVSKVDAAPKKSKTKSAKSKSKSAKPKTKSAKQASTPAKPAVPSAPPVSASNPMHVAYINAIDNNKDAAYDTIGLAFKKMKEVTRIEQEIVDSTAKSYGLKNADFKNDQSRALSKSDIHKAASDLRADVFIVVDITEKGKKLELIALDTNGKEIHSEKKNLRRGKISRRDAKKMLAAVLKGVRPTVDKFRKDGGWTKPTPPPAPAAPPAAEESAKQDPGVAAVLAPPSKKVQASTNVKAKKTKKEEGKQTFLFPVSMFTASAFGTFGITNVNLHDPDKNKIDYSSRYPGGALMLNSTFTFGKRFGLGFSAFGGYSMYKTDLYVYKDPNNHSKGTKLKERMTSTLIFAQAQIDIPIAITKNIMVSPFVGGDFRMLKINNGTTKIDFNGDQFIGGRAGLMFNIAVAGFYADIGGGVVPTLVNKVADDAHGTSKFLLSYEGRAVMAYEIIPHLAVVGGYNFRLTTGELTGKASATAFFKKDPVSLTDMSHMGLLGVQFRL